jgi:hypothetical protein
MKPANTFHIAAAYVERHEPDERYLFPLAFGQKGQPCIKDNLAQASVDLNQLDTWSKMFPGCLWGCSCKKSGLICVDIDMGNGKNGIQSARELAKQGSILPKTETDSTPSGGSHLVYYGPHRFSASKIGLHIDTPNYFVIPGCVRFDGKSYAVKFDRPAVSAPKWIIDKIWLPQSCGEGQGPDLGEPIPLDLFRDMLKRTPYTGGPNGMNDRRTYQGWLSFAMAAHDAAGGREDEYLDAFINWCLDDPEPGRNRDYEHISRHWESFT